ncbi:MAG: glycoside hydrolase family 3 C-terminal domain-containing protein [Lachnospiraceae bacterium]|nr:glycoside hydrolase family 3 C-terminal domain-containing protein [Lachnospiraceae bacterium]
MEIKKIIEQLTLEEKAALVGGADAWNTAKVERLGIPSVRVSDGPHGLRKTLDDSSLGIDGTVKAVCFPTGSGLAATWNREALERLGGILGRECRAEGVNVILGPAVNIKRSPLCGRNFEYFSEDPYLAGQLGSAYVKGVQAEGVGVSLKHFAANNQEKRRMTVSSVIDERTLREIYLSAFEEIVKSAEPDTVMCSYNKVNGTYSSENGWLLNEILRNEWGYDGLVMSDWGAVCDRAKGVEAGLDLEMPSSNGLSAKRVVDAVIAGELDEKYLDIAVEHVLKLANKYTGFADETCVAQEEKPEFDRVADHKDARRIARESMVLLKNDGALPLNKEQKILFVGEFARKPRIQGGGSSHINCTRIISAMEASTRHAKVEYAKGFSAFEDKIDEELAEEAVLKAQEADVVVIFAGLPDSFESEGYDRTHMRLPQCQNRVIREITAVQPNTVVVLHNGSPMSMPWVDDVNAILEAYLGGEASGEAVVDLLFGVVSPSGKLAETFPIALKDTPCYNNFPGNRLTVEYREGLFVGYRYYEKVGAEVLFPFGHGLSYTTFVYDEINVKSGNKNATVKFKVKNNGNRPGSEIVQVYVSKLDSKIFRAEKELKGFDKIRLEPGEEKEVTIELNERAFSYYSTSAGKWIVEPGKYVIHVGSSSADIRLREEICFECADEEVARIPAEQLPSYYSGSPACVGREEFEILLGTPLPDSERACDEPITIHDTMEDARKTKWGRRLYGPVYSVISGRKVIGNHVVDDWGFLEMPFHSILNMSQGRLKPDTLEAVINLLNDVDVIDNIRFLGNRGMTVTGNALGALSEKLSSYKNERQVKEMADNENGMDKLVNTLENAGEKLGEIGRDVIDRLEKSDLLKKAEEAGLKLGDKIDELHFSEKLDGAVSRAAQKAEEAGLKEKLDDLGGKLGEAGEQLMKKLEESGVQEKLKDAGDQLESGLKKAAQGFEEKIKNKNE